MNPPKDIIQNDIEKMNWQEKVLVVIPVYNHIETVHDVAVRSLKHSLDVLVVDDGSQDDVASVVSDLDVAVIRHDSNKGKGRAILTAAQYAAENNKTHIITLDADGQHYPEQIPDFFKVINDHPDAITMGVRDFTSSNAPLSSRFGREFGNFWVRIQTGVKVRDIQSGFRAYPVFVLQHLKYIFDTYAFEDEVIVRALWAGVSVKEMPVKVYYPRADERVSHFQKFKDNVKLTVLNTYLTIRSLVPWPHRQIQFKNRAFYTISHPLKIVKELLASQHRPSRLALAGALGVFLGTLPLIACHTLAIIYAASMLRLNKIMAIATSQICMPPVVPALCIEIGYFLRFGKFLTFQNASSLTDASFKELGYMGLDRLAEWFIGSLILGPLLALATGAVVFVLSLYAQKTFLRAQRNLG
jgi:glycosyltransferase involved in cell wall biosynthesis